MTIKTFKHVNKAGIAFLFMPPKDCDEQDYIGEVITDIEKLNKVSFKYAQKAMRLN